jgi:hypothetical protein
VSGGRRLTRSDRARLDAGEMRGVMSKAAGRPELTVADAIDPDFDLSPDRFDDHRMTCAAMLAGSVISALASRAGMSSQPLGGGNRPTCEVLIRVVFLCMSQPSSGCCMRFRA